MIFVLINQFKQLFEQNMSNKFVEKALKGGGGGNLCLLTRGTLIKGLALWSTNPGKPIGVF